MPRRGSRDRRHCHGVGGGGRLRRLPNAHLPLLTASHPSSLSAAVTPHPTPRRQKLVSGSWSGPEGQREKESGQVKAEQVQESLGDWLENTCVEGVGCVGRYQRCLSYSPGNELCCSLSRWARLSPARQENSSRQTLFCGPGLAEQGPCFPNLLFSVI